MSISSGSRSICRLVAWGQGGYFALTGIWPLIHLPSFLMVTGPKTDLWLVRTVGVLITAIGASLLVAAWRGRIDSETITLAVAGALGLASIDVVYVSASVIARIYLLDAAAEVLIVVAWFVAIRCDQRATSSKRAQSTDD